MDYIPTGKKPEFKYSIGDFVCFSYSEHNYYGQIKFYFYENGEPIYGVQTIFPVRQQFSGSPISSFDMDGRILAVYEKSIF